jgi:outer membrane protein assembly factor BamB
MEFLMKHTSFLALILCLLLTAGCSKTYKMKPSERELPSPWTFARQDKQATAAITTTTFSGNLSRCWETSSNDKPSGPLSVQKGHLIYSGTRKKLKFYDVSSGRYLGSLKSGFAAQSGVVIEDTIAYWGTAPYRNRMFAVNLRNRSRLWDSETHNIANGLLYHDHQLLGATGDGRVFALDPDEGTTIWQHQTPDRFTAGPSLHEHMLYQPSDIGKIYYLRATDGKLGCTARLMAAITGQVAVGDLVFACDVLGNVGAFDRSVCDTRWTRTLDGPIWGAPALAENTLYVGVTTGRVWAIDGSTGHDLWYTDLGEVIKAGVIVVGDHVIAATMRGKLFAISRADGSITSQAQIHGAVEQSPVSDGHRIFVATQKGKIAAFGHCATARK